MGWCYALFVCRGTAQDARNASVICCLCRKLACPCSPYVSGTSLLLSLLLSGEHPASPQFKFSRTLIADSADCHVVILCCGRDWCAFLSGATARIQAARPNNRCISAPACQCRTAIEHSDRAAPSDRISQTNRRRGGPGADVGQRDGCTNAGRLRFAFLFTSVGARCLDAHSADVTEHWRASFHSILECRNS